MSQWKGERPILTRQSGLVQNLTDTDVATAFLMNFCALLFGKITGH
jgi:hypothetical protein